MQISMRRPGWRAATGRRSGSCLSDALRGGRRHTGNPLSMHQRAVGGVLAARPGGWRVGPWVARFLVGPNSTRCALCRFAIWRHVHARVTRADVGERLLVPIFAARWRPPEEVAFTRRHSFQGVDHLVPAGVMGPTHLALPAPAALLEVDQHDEARALRRAELGTAMEHIGLVDKEAARWRFRKDLLVEEFAQGALARRERQILRVFERHKLGWAVNRSNLRQQDECRHLRVPLVEARHDQRVIAEIAMVRLVIVDRAGILGPQLDLVDFDVLRAEKAFGGIDQIGIDRDTVERPARIRKEAQPRELASREFRMLRRVGEILFRLGIDFPERIPRILQHRRIEKSLDDCEALVPNLCEIFVGNAHGHTFARNAAAPGMSTSSPKSEPASRWASPPRMEAVAM